MDLTKGDAKPADAKAALLKISQTLSARERLTIDQTVYLRTALELWASGKTLEQAFGFKRARAGRRSIAIERQIEIAVEVMRGLLAGCKLAAAARKAGELKGCDKSRALKYWAEHKGGALLVIRSERPPDRYPWTAKEVPRLKAMKFATDLRELDHPPIKNVDKSK